MRRRSSRKAFKRRGIALQLGKQCTQVEDPGSHLVVHFGEGETAECDLMLVSVGRAPLVDGLGLEAAGSHVRPAHGHPDRRSPAHRRCRTSTPRATLPVYWQLAHTGFREGEIAAENAMGHEARDRRARGAAPDLHRPRDRRRRAHRGSRRASSTATNVAVGRFPWVANARAVMSGDTVGWVKSIHETTYGELLGVVIVGPHATDLIEAGVVALDAESTIETVADGIAAAPDALRGPQGCRARRARTRDPPAARRSRRSSAYRDAIAASSTRRKAADRLP